MNHAVGRPQDFGYLCKLMKPAEWKGPVTGLQKEGQDVSKTEIYFSPRRGCCSGCHSNSTGNSAVTYHREGLSEVRLLKLQAPHSLTTDVTDQEMALQSKRGHSRKEGGGLSITWHKNRSEDSETRLPL